MRKRVLILFSILVVFSVAGCWRKGDDSANRTVAPDFTLRDLQGREIRLSDYRGKVVILDFWDTWCPPCRAEIPFFIELYDQYRSHGFEMIGVTFAKRGIEAVRSFVEEYGINYPTLIGNQEVVRNYGGIRGLPTTYVIDKKGGVYKKYVGFRDKAVFEEDIKSLLSP